MPRCSIVSAILANYDHCIASNNPASGFESPAGRPEKPRQRAVVPTCSSTTSAWRRSAAWRAVSNTVYTCRVCVPAGACWPSCRILGRCRLLVRNSWSAEIHGHGRFAEQRNDPVVNPYLGVNGRTFQLGRQREQLERRPVLVNLKYALHGLQSRADLVEKDGDARSEERRQ